MRTAKYLNRSAAQIENDRIRVTVTTEGGHIAELLHKQTGVNPLWVPPWPSIEPSSFDPARHPEYGGHAEAQLLSGILGHNVCLDLFGAPSSEEAAAGIPVHGEAPVAHYEISGDHNTIEMQTVLPKAQLRFERRIYLSADSTLLRISESIENLSATDRPIGWTEHVTIGPPFLEPGLTQFRVSASHSKVMDASFNDGQGLFEPNAEFEWPFCPLKNGAKADLRIFPADRPSGGFTAHLMDPRAENAWFAAWSPTTRVLLAYMWKRSDFPWLARWEENHLRTQPPWNGNGLACGMEFGASPFVESRRDMVNRGTLFGTPTFRWIPAQTSVRVEYCACITTRDAVPERAKWDGSGEVSFD
ncbi:MAG: hypothetical protein JO061_21315 [Acidobacteriaceae bacterium]|nr:hypothetical protein [Acidobacteriaceae bacterium]